MSFVLEQKNYGGETGNRQKRKFKNGRMKTVRLTYPNGQLHYGTTNHLDRTINWTAQLVMIMHRTMMITSMVVRMHPFSSVRKWSS